MQTTTPDRSGQQHAVIRNRERAIRGLWFLTASVATIVVFFIILFLIKDALPILQTVSLTDFIFGGVWNPTGAIPSYGIWPLIVGTLLVTFLSILIAAPLGIGSAIFISECASPRVKNVAKPAVELLAGIPSVVYGFFGLIVLTTTLRVTFDIPSGESWLAGSILLAIMALPTIISVSEDAITAVPREFKEGSLAIGANHWQTISKVLLPASLSGITAAIILGIGRAIGETMAVMMVTGNAAIIPDPIYNVLSPVRTLTGTLGIEMGEVAAGSSHYHALFGVAVVLLAITLIINLSARYILGHIRNKQIGSSSKKISRFSISPEKLPVTYLKYTGAALGVLVLLLVFGFLITGGLLAACLAIWYLRRVLSPAHVQKVAFLLIGISITIVFLFLAIILYDVISNGLPAISWEFLTQPPSRLGREGGIFPAIVGTLYLVAGAILIALPLGIGAAIYLIEYTKENRITQIIRTGVDLLNGTPSIVFGLFGFTFLVLYLDFGICLLSGMITLALMILPTIIRTTEEALRSVPHSLREGSLALGATQWETIRKVVLPPALPGIITGAILSIGRAAGETAPIMFVAVVFNQRHLPDSVFDPVMALPYHLFVLATNVPGATTNQYGTALVLIALVVALYLVAIVIRNHYHKTMRW